MILIQVIAFTACEVIKDRSISPKSPWTLSLSQLPGEAEVSDSVCSCMCVFLQKAGVHQRRKTPAGKNTGARADNYGP